MPRNIFAIIEDLASGVTELRAALTPLVSLTSPKKSKPASARKPKKVARPKKSSRRPLLTRRVRAFRSLQGKYMALVKRLTAAQQDRVKKVREKQGYEAAMKVAASFKKTK